MGAEFLACFRCGRHGHVARECGELLPAAGKAEHQARIQLYIQRWLDGKWTAREKQVAISQENKMWYGKDAPASLTL